MKTLNFRVVTLLSASICLALIAMTAPLGGHGQASPSPASGQLLDRISFASGAPGAGPMVRWWWPGGDVDPAEIDRELGEIARAGFSGVELQSFAVGLPQTPGSAVFTHGSDAWFEQVAGAAATARALGLKLDLTLGSAWPSGGDHVDDANSLKQLTVTGQFVVGPTHLDQSLPAPTEPLYYQFAEDLLSLPNTFDDTKMSPVAVIAVRLDPNQSPDYEPGQPTLPDLPELPPTVYLDPATATFLSDRLTPDGRLVWDVPDGSWALFTFFGGPTGSRPFYSADALGGLVLDHFSQEAIGQHLSVFGGRVEDHLAGYFGTTLSSVFVDSLELRSELFWTEDLLAEFLVRRGYRLEPFLPVLNEPFQADAYMSKVYPDAPPGFEMRALGPRVRYDYDRTLAELMNERFFAPIHEWADARGLQSRVQAHGGPVELLSAYAESHIPETEGLFAGGSGAFLKTASSAAHLHDKPIVSSEIFAFRLPFDSTSPTAMLRRANENLAAGVNQLVLHGFPYLYDEGFDWPGWMPFDSDYLPGRELIGTFGTRLNDRHPYWSVLTDVNRYLARAQLVGRVGTPRTDVALWVEATNYPDDPAFEPETHGVLRGSGYDYDYVDRWTLASGEVAAGALRIGKRSYKALVVADASKMPLDLADKILELAGAGLPIAFVGDVPAATPGYLNFMANDADLTATMTELFGQARDDVVGAEKLTNANVVFVRESGKLPEALGEDLGVTPELLWGADGVDLRYVHREAGAADYYFIHNRRPSRLDIEVSFPNQPQRVPEIWDLWTGVVEPAIVYTNDGDRTRVQLHFEPGDAVVVGFDTIGSVPHLETTDLTAVRRNADGTLTAVVDSPGDYSVVYNGGILTSVAVSGPELPSIELPEWDVVGTAGATTTYAAVIDMSTMDPGYLSQAVGLVLDLGPLSGVAGVSVNGGFVARLIRSPYDVEVTGLVGPGHSRITLDVTLDSIGTPVAAPGPSRLHPIYKATLAPPQPLQMSVNVVPPNFPDNDNADMLAAIARSTELVDHVSFQWFWKTPPNDANPQGGAVVDCNNVATWVEQARSLDLGVTLQFQTFFTQVEGDYALGRETGRLPVVQVATPVMPFETATFADDRVRAAYLEQIGCLASLAPEYLVLGPEMNFVYVFDRPEWEIFLPVYRDAYHVVKTISPRTQVGISYQYDGMQRDFVLNGDTWDYIGAASPSDFVALTTYYGFSEERFAEYPEPFLIPDDYYRPIRTILGESKPIIFSEVGWSSFFEDGEVTQSEFVKRMPSLIGEARPDHVIWALLHDVSYFEGPGQSLNQSGLLARTGEPKPAWHAALRLRDEAVFESVRPNVFAPAPLPFSMNAAPANFPAEPITVESGAAAIATASELASHVSFQFSWRDEVTGQTWECDQIRPFVEEADRQGVGVTLQFNTYTPVLSSDPDADPAIVLANPIDPPVPPYESEAAMRSITDPGLRDAYLEQIGCIAAMQPDYLVLGPEVNFLAIYRPGELTEFASVFQDARALVKSISPETQVGVSIQYDILLDELLSGSAASWIDEFGTRDYVGLTSYFATSDERHEKFGTALDLPANYYDAAREVFGPDIPIVFTEVAWSSFYSLGPENQVLFLNRLPTLLQRVAPVNVIWGLQHDILDYYSGEIFPLNHIGLRELDGATKPGWQQVLDLTARGIYRSP